MRRILLVALATLYATALAASAQSYRLEFSGDNTLSSCELTSGGIGYSSIHVVLTGSGSVTALLFGAPVPACWEGTTWIRDNLAVPGVYPSSQETPGGDYWLAIGDTQDPLGLSVAFGECRELPLHIGTIEFMGVAPAACCDFAVTHPSGWDTFATPAQVADCSFTEHDAAGSSVRVSSGSSCPCQQALATQQSTWGRVKSLYR